MSSIDTKSIISQLMAVERRPQDLLKTRVSALQKTQTSWQTIADKLTGLKTAADALAPMRAVEAITTATSSDTDAIVVTPKGAGRNTTADIEVVDLAAARTDVSTDTFTAATDSLGARTLSLTVDGETTAYTSGDGTIGGLVSAINAADKGVTAKLLQTAPGQFKLSLTAAETGVDNAFSITQTGWTGFGNVRPAANATIKVDGVTVSRSTNTIDDVIEGLELKLKKATTAPVEITFARDDQAISDKVKALVDAANGALNSIATATKTGTDAESRGPLAADPSARRLADEIRSVIARPVSLPDGSTLTAKQLGVTLNRDGTLKFDAAALKETLTDNPDGVIDALGRASSSSAAGVSVTSATSAASAGSQVITVTQAATRASLVSVPSPPPPPGSTVNMTIVTPQGSFSVSFSAGSSYAATATNMTAAMRGLGLRISAAATSTLGVEDGIQMVEDRYGSGRSFTVSGASDLGLDGIADDGLDAEGTINGSPFTASGRTFSSNGLAINVATTEDQISGAGGTVTGSVTFSEGLSGALARLGARGSSTGPALSAKTAITDQIKGLQDRIARFDGILTQRENALVRKFSNMESLLSRLNTMNGGFG